MTQTLSQLENRDTFTERYISSSAQQQQEMLRAVGADSLNTLIGRTVPQDIQLTAPSRVGGVTTEFTALAELKAIASRNKRFRSYIGTDYTAMQLPPVTQRSMLGSPGWYTTYTPYQPGVSQDCLEPLLNFQQVTLNLTGLDIVSTSLFDETTAAVEAMAMTERINKPKNASRFFITADVHPQTLDTVRTHAKTLGFDVTIDNAGKVFDHQDVSGVLLQQVGTAGETHNYSRLIIELRTRRVIAGVATDLMTLVLLTALGKQDANIVFGSAQRLGVPTGYGGPRAAFFAAEDRFRRSMPSRIIGVSEDTAGNTVLHMATQAHEQHIRRGKADSNICTSQVLLANIASLYTVSYDPTDLKRIAGRTRHLTDILADGLQKEGLKLRHIYYFDILCVEVTGKAAVLVRVGALQISLYNDVCGMVGTTLDEAATREDVLSLFRVYLSYTSPSPRDS